MERVNIDQLVAEALVPMTKKDKLQRWARLCREYGYALNLFNSLEYWNLRQLQEIKVCGTGTAMSLAADDSVFHAAGLPQDASVMDVIKFFELSQSQLHEFSCDCGGNLNNDEQARRIERIA